MLCPCTSGNTYEKCCQPYHDDNESAPTAEKLMRSRYSAYALNKPAYIYRTWSAQTRPTKQSLKKTKPLHWLGLEIVRTEAGGPMDNKGIVEFIASYQDDAGAEAKLHETSRFTRENQRWVYVEGDY